MSEFEVKQLKFEGLIHQDKKGFWVAKRGLGEIITHGNKGRGHNIFSKGLYARSRGYERRWYVKLLAEKYGLQGGELHGQSSLRIFRVSSSTQPDRESMQQAMQRRVD